MCVGFQLPSVSNGVLVAEVISHSPAEAAGIKAGDVLIAYVTVPASFKSQISITHSVYTIQYLSEPPFRFVTSAAVTTDVN